MAMFMAGWEPTTSSTAWSGFSSKTSLRLNVEHTHNFIANG